MKLIYTLQKSVFVTLLSLMFSFSALLAQNDSVYLMKDGKIVGQYNVTTEIDSVVFYNPANPSQTSGVFTDARDGNVYGWVTIGNQVWMAENLAYLPNVVGPATYSNEIAYYYVYSNNGNIVCNAKSAANYYGSFYDTYGVLYNWAAAMNGECKNNSKYVQGVCPTGWHLPSDAEWNELSNFVGGLNIAGGVLKDTGTVRWDSPNVGATNGVGFSALPAGHRHPRGAFDYIGENGYWWTATEESASMARTYNIHNSDAEIFRSPNMKEYGYSVRCVKD